MKVDFTKYIRVFTSEDEKWELVNDIRAKLLKDSDWTQTADVIKMMEPDEQAAWLAYRQALRDIPQVYINADNVELPEKPVRPVQPKARDVKKIPDVEKTTAL